MNRWVGLTLTPDVITFDSLEEHIRHFRDASRRGLPRIYPDKREAVKRMAQKLQGLREPELVRMLGFTLRRYVHPSALDAAGRTVENEVGCLFRDAICDKGARVQLLLLHRSGGAARERMAIESPSVRAHDARKTIFYKDSLDTVAYCKRQKWYRPVRGDGSRLAIKYYQHPYVGMVIFKDELFVELYHLGDDGETAANDAQRTICGRVAILVIKRDTPFYKLFESHFRRVWERGRWA